MLLSGLVVAKVFIFTEAVQDVFEKGFKFSFLLGKNEVGYSLRRVMVLPFLVLSIQPVNLRLTRKFETNDLYLHSLNQ